MSTRPRKESEPRDRDARAEALETKLFSILGLVNDWLKFAEAKNVGVVGLSSGATAVLLSHATGQASITTPAGIVFGASGACLILSLLSGLLSFFPRTDSSGIVGAGGAVRTRPTICTSSATSPGILPNSWPPP